MKLNNQYARCHHELQDLVVRFGKIDDRVIPFTGIHVGYDEQFYIMPGKYGAVVDRLIWEGADDMPDELHLYISPLVCDNPPVRDFIVGHELAHVYLDSLWPLPYGIRSIAIEMFCDSFSFDLNKKLDDRPLRDSYMHLDLLSMTQPEFSNDEFITRLSFMKEVLDKLDPITTYRFPLGGQTSPSCRSTHGCL